MDDARRPLEKHASRALPQRLQYALVGTAMVVIAVAAGLESLVTRFTSGPEEAQVTQQAQATTTTATAPTGFKPTKAQWANIKIAPARPMDFVAADVTDGKIALNADKITQVFSPYSGRVTKIYARLGDHVTQGAPLLQLEASEFVQGQNDLLTAVAARNKASAQLNLMRINEKRQHELYDAKAGALKDWESAQNDLSGAENDFRSSEIAVAAVRNRLRILGKSDAEIDALENAKKMDPGATVYAPIAGTVTDRQVGLGQYIQSGASNPVFTIGDLTTVWLIANVRETDAPKIQIGEPVVVHVLAFPGKEFKAKITYVAPSLDPNTHRLPVRAEVENPGGALKPEMFANFSIITGEALQAVGVPQDSVIYEGDEAHVWVGNPDQGLALRKITVGRSNGGMVEVTSGLKPDETVVTSGTLFIDRAAKGE